MRSAASRRYVGRNQRNYRRKRCQLGIILLFALILRFYGLDFGLPAILDSDELIFLLGSWQMVESGSLNPQWFGHPATTTMYVLAITNGMVFGIGLIAGEFASADHFAQAVFFNPGLLVLPGRGAMALFGVASVCLVYLLTARFSGHVAGLFAAGLLAINPAHISWSQVIRSDIMATTFLLLAMLASWRLLSQFSQRYMIHSCLFVALAVASKWPFAVAFLAIVGALILRVRQDKQTRVDCIGTIVIAIFLSFVLLLTISPFLLLDFPTLLSNLEGETQSKHVGATGSGFAGNMWMYLSGALLRSLGPIGFFLALFGMICMRRNAGFWVIVGLPSLAMLVLISAQDLFWERWAIPLIPFFCIAAGIAADRIVKYSFNSNQFRVVAASCVAIAMMLPILPIYLDSITERMHDNRRQATDWVRQNLPIDAEILVEHFAFDLANSSFQLKFPLGIGGCQNPRQLLTERIDYQKVDSLRGGNSNLDLASVPSVKMASCDAEFAILTEYARYDADQSRFPMAHQRYQYLIAQGEVLKRFPAVAGAVGGRPEVLVLDLRQQNRTGNSNAAVGISDNY